MAYENYTINQFRRAMFKGDRSVMNDEEFKIVHTEYIDTAGLYEIEEFEKVGYITYLNGRINGIKLCVRLQLEFLNNFDIPYVNGFEYVKKKYGHKLFWDGNKDAFLNALKNLERSNNKTISELEGCMKDLIEYRLKKNNKEIKIEETSGGFVRTLISLGKCNYRIDNDKTTVEELAYMIKQQMEDSKHY